MLRKDNSIKIINSKDNFDTQMQEYASIIQYKKKFLMFYNGNKFGEKGIGLAVLKTKKNKNFIKLRSLNVK